MQNNRSIQRCLAILRAFRVNVSPTLAELSRAVELPHPTVLRFLLTLEEEGYVARDAGGHWRLTTRMLELGFAAMEGLGVADAVQEQLQALADAYSGTSNLGEAHPEGVIIIGRTMTAAERRRLVVMNLRVGSILPPGSALADALPLGPGEHARRAYPETQQVSLAVPVRGVLGRQLSIGISTTAAVLESEAQELEAVRALQDKADSVGRILGLAAV
ncbi:helix-turn-helix domain-containing protein [Diaphorobacter ruginosibacter]|uniref:Helix-turn-helix domain-containing protein n=1 Tax=Diaphorobacter ruginosibacter TaxID=1715720 RepID=A0A7G9RQ41_9BURK|nr:helix-turn-helix domain-containing protein [Diaphorobacter ruginosibacter]